MISAASHEAIDCIELVEMKPDAVVVDAAAVVVVDAAAVDAVVAAAAVASCEAAPSVVVETAVAVAPGVVVLVAVGGKAVADNSVLEVDSEVLPWAA